MSAQGKTPFSKHSARRLLARFLIRVDHRLNCGKVWAFVREVIRLTAFRMHDFSIGQFIGEVFHKFTKLISTSLFSSSAMTHSSAMMDTRHAMMIRDDSFWFMVQKVFWPLELIQTFSECPPPVCILYILRQIASLPAPWSMCADLLLWMNFDAHKPRFVRQRLIGLRYS